MMLIIFSIVSIMEFHHLFPFLKEGIDEFVIIVANLFLICSPSHFIIVALVINSFMT